MKQMKLFTIAFLTFVTVFSVRADEKKIAFNQLPVTSQEFIRKHFDEKDVLFIKEDRDFFDRSYEVILVDGSKIEFDNTGEWATVSLKIGKIPNGIVPGEIEDFVRKNHPNLFIIKIERDKKSYEIELSNEIEIEFDLNYNLIGYDD